MVRTRPVRSAVVLGFVALTACEGGPLDPSSSEVGLGAPALAIGPGDIASASVIDMENAPAGPVGDFYAPQGVTMANLTGSWTYDTGTGNGASRVACNITDAMDFPAPEILFSQPVVRAGFYITTNDRDDVEVTAYAGDTAVGSEPFETGGNGAGGSFLGVEFAQAFDRLVITPTRVVDGAICMDDLRFDVASAEGDPGEGGAGEGGEGGEGEESEGEEGEGEEAAGTVAIDIKPGADDNSINPRSRGVIPVAILSSTAFDVAELDPASLTFGATGDEASIQLRGGKHAVPNCSAGDVNGDGLADLLCHFHTEITGLAAGDTQATLKGVTFGGAAVVGTDAVRIVGAK